MFSLSKTTTVVFILCLLIWRNASATLISVPAQYATIQAAILASVNGDTVAVSPGTYYENINFRGRNIVLTSLFYLNNDTSYISSTIINGSQPTNPDTASCIILNSYEDSTTLIQGFTITGGAGTKWVDIHGAGTYREGGGILTEFSDPVIRYNFIHDNYVNNTVGVNSTGGGAIRCGDGNPIIINNVICNNQAFGYGGGIVLNYCTGNIVNNLIVYNTGGNAFGGGGIWLTGTNNSTEVNILNNTVAFNQSTGTGTYGGKAGGLFVFSIKANLRNNIFWGNTQTTGSVFATFFSGTIAAEYCDIQNTTAGTGNISTDPLFADSTYFLLGAGSPCIDAGDSAVGYNDSEISPGIAAFPSMGTERNDMGMYGGQKVAAIPVCLENVTGLSDLPDYNSTQLFPNPAASFLNIQLSNPEHVAYQAELYTVTGQQVLKQQLPGTANRLDISSLSNGFYVLKIYSSEKIYSVKKIQIIR